MSNLQTYYHFKIDFQKVDQHTRGKWIHGTKPRKDNQLHIVLLWPALSQRCDDMEPLSSLMVLFRGTPVNYPHEVPGILSFDVFFVVGLSKVLNIIYPKRLNVHIELACKIRI